jgi:hypothetical protein
MRDSWHHFIVVALSQSAWSQASQKWVVSWVASAQGPYPVGNVSAQPDQRFAFPDPAAGARDAGDKLHPNRAGYLAMGMVIDLDLFRSKQQR